MEIFKATAQQQMNTFVGPEATSTQRVSAAEQTKIQQDSLLDAANKAQNAQDGEQIERSLSEAIDKLNENMADLGTNIRFGYNDKIDYMFVNVMEANSGNIIRKIPTEQAMKLTEHFRDVIGLIFDKKE